MTAELGTFFLIIALLAALHQGAALLPSGRFRSLLLASQLQAAWLQALCVTLALATLVVLRIECDFSVTNVVAHSNLTLPLLYKIAGTWGNHEGSMLLFTWVLAAFGVTLAAVRSEIPNALRQSAVAVQSLVGAGALLFVLLTSNPFARIFPPPADGDALNPVLQDIALAIHPPLLYVGYVGFSIVFSLSVAALLHRQVESTWARAVHPWILTAWSALTLGIGLGSWWAYRELGWGGWWFWDPVENASLLPWLAGTALLHSNIVLQKRNMLAHWVSLLAIVTFGLSLTGTFLVRSGALLSVHSFASDPERGLFILVYMVITIGSALLLFALRAGAIPSQEGMLPVSREGIIVINNLFLVTACATVLLGTAYPLMTEWLSGDKLTVGPPYFNATFLPLMAISLIFAGLAPLMPWKKASLRDDLIRAQPALLAAGAVVFIVLATAARETLSAAVGFGMAAWLAASSVQWVIKARGNNRLPVFIGHLGVAVMVAGITGVSLGKEEAERWVRPGDAIDIGGYHLAYAQETRVRKPNYLATLGEFKVSDAAGRPVTVLIPEYRAYDIRRTSTSEASIHASLFSDLYAVLGESHPDGRTAARVYYVPMIRFIWAGYMLMALSGIIALLQRMKVNSGRSAI